MMANKQTGKPGVDRERAEAALAGAQQQSPLDLVVEVVEYRYRERRKQNRRWWIGMAIAISTLYLAAAAILFDMVQHAEAEAETVSRRLDTPRQEPATNGGIVQPGTPKDYLLETDQSVRFRLENIQDATYAIDVVASDDNFDPILYLYRQDENRLVTVSSDDDGGEEYNSRIVEELSANTTYYAQVEGHSGSSGSFTLNVEQLF